MTFNKILILIILLFTQVILETELIAQSNPNSNPALDAREQSIVTIAAFTAQGILEKLQGALHHGLDAILTINESKEVLVHLYAYCGFPRSIRGLQTMMEVVEDHQSRGIQDETGRPHLGMRTKISMRKAKRCWKNLSGLARPASRWTALNRVMLLSVPSLRCF